MDVINLVTHYGQSIYQEPSLWFRGTNENHLDYEVIVHAEPRINSRPSDSISDPRESRAVWGTPGDLISYLEPRPFGVKWCGLEICD